jgi:hypothetical protein
MKTKISFFPERVQVQGHCYNCGRPFFDLEYATEVDKRGECVFCRTSELKGAEKARKIIGRTYKNILSERALRKLMRGGIKEDIGLIHILFGNLTISGAICRANRLGDK